jgi:peptidoglycan/LPS O-acetylase OafA/YrhL
MGLLRFTLAMLVLFSHMGWSINGFNPGVTAVVIFYLLSGYVVDRLLHSGQALGKHAGQFYLDRLWRLLPAYLGALLFSAAIWRLLRPQTHFLSAEPNLLTWLGNLTIIPLNYYMYNGIDRFTLLPPAWSLGTEIQFYLLAPLIFRLPGRLFLLLYGLSFSVWLLAQTPLLNTDHFGYRLLPGVLFIFMTGMLQARRNNPARTPPAGTDTLLKALWPLLLGYLLLLWLTGTHRPHDREVATGLLLILSAIQRPARTIANGPEPGWSRHLGHYAYGIFLLHFPLLWLQHSLLPGSEWRFLLVPAGTILLAMLIHHAVERPCWRKLRSRWLPPAPRLANGP